MSLWARKLSFIGLNLTLAAVLGCGGEGASPTSPDSSKTVQPGEATSPVQESEQITQETTSATHVPAQRGIVLANRELGMAVHGQGSGNPARSLEMLERQVITLLPDIREIYDRERMNEPGMMGSLDVNMTIEPNGGVSDLRFPVKRVSNDRLTSAVFDELRTWTFPPDDLSVQLRFTLLFIPPGIDEASILLWEKRLGSRPVIEKVGEAPPPVIAAAPSPERLSSGETAKQHAGAVKKPADVVAPRSKPTETAKAVGWYRILQPTVLRAAPDISSRAVAGLRKGLRVRVVGVVKGQWLEIHSINNRSPGFLRLEDAAPERTERAERK